MSRRVAAGAIAAIVIGAAAAGCGVPTGDSSFEEIPSEQILFGLDETSTTATTTTTTTTVPVIPDTIDTTTTTTPVRNEPAEIYFLTRSRLFPTVQDLPMGASSDQIADVLEEGPPEGAGLDTLIEDGLIVATETTAGVLSVDLDPDTFDRIPANQQTEAIAQIVLTMTRSVRGVGQVTFTLGGEPIAVKKGNGLLSEVGQPVSYDDFAMLIARPTTVTSTTTATTQPPVEPAATLTSTPDG